MARCRQIETVGADVQLAWDLAAACRQYVNKGLLQSPADVLALRYLLAKQAVKWASLFIYIILTLGFFLAILLF